MRDEKYGFFIEQISVLGDNVSPAELTFSDGLNVIEGASDTGKSFAVELIDYLLGSSKLERMIAEAKPYNRATLRLRERVSGRRFEIVRRMKSGTDVEIRELGPSGEVVSTRVIGAKHAPGIDSTLSAFLLSLSGFSSQQVRTNAQGKLRGLSFRDAGFLCIIDEKRIIETHPPHKSGQYIEATVEGSVLRLFVTGVDAKSDVVLEKPSKVAKGQSELLEQLLAEAERDIADLGFANVNVSEELARIEQSRSKLFDSLDQARSAMLNIEIHRKKIHGEMRTNQTRLFVVEGLIKRFELLRHHYESDMLRLAAIEEAGELLDEIEPQSCAICGAPAKEHRPDFSSGYHTPVAVSAAAHLEREKIIVLAKELSATLAGLREEEAKRMEAHKSYLIEIAETEALIAEQIAPRQLACSDDLRRISDRRDTLLRAQGLLNQARDWRARLSKPRVANLKSVRSSEPSSPPHASTLDVLAHQIQDLLKAWNYPPPCDVIFSDDSQDVVVGGEPRADHGKGVRAVTCSAFILALMKHCSEVGLPHPRFVVLDSPLVAYADPDPTDEALRKAGLAEGFYRSLADADFGQIIVFENKAPPADVLRRIGHSHFSGSRTGRWGFFPPKQTQT